jgi:DNA-binding CsgD family transcriptional regulator
MLSHVDLLQQFIRYFRDKAQPLIQQAEKNPVVISHLTPEQPKKSFALAQEQKLQFINSLKGLSMTKREFECLELLAHGLTSKEIARKLDIHPKTVDRHLESLKDKMNARNRIDLLRLTAFIR